MSEYFRSTVYQSHPSLCKMQTGSDNQPLFLLKGNTFLLACCLVVIGASSLRGKWSSSQHQSLEQKTYWMSLPSILCLRGSFSYPVSVQQPDLVCSVPLLFASASDSHSFLLPLALPQKIEMCKLSYFIAFSMLTTLFVSLTDCAAGFLLGKNVKYLALLK